MAGADELRVPSRDGRDRLTASAKSRASFAVSKLFVHHDTHPLTLDTVLIRKYGVQWFEWQPETLWREIKEDFRTSSISDHNRQKIQAVRSLHISDWCWTKWEIFCPVVQALNNNIPDFEVLNQPTPAQMVNAVDIMDAVRDDVPWDQEVQGFIAAALMSQSLSYACPPLEFAQDEIDRLIEDQGLSNISRLVERRWDEVKNLPLEQVALQENPVDVQVARVVVAQDYLQMRRSQLRTQMQAL